MERECILDIGYMSLFSSQNFLRATVISNIRNVDSWQNPFHNPWAKSRNESNEPNYAMIRQYRVAINDM